MTEPHKIRALLVDDEPLARKRLQRLLVDMPMVEVIAEAENGQQAVDLSARLKPDLVFMDIQMPIKNGVDAAQEITQMQLKSPAVIFCTAYDQYAIEAFKVQAAAYLLKPVSKEDLLQAVQQATQINRLQSSHSGESFEPEINISHTNHTERLSASEILYFRSEEKHVVVGLLDGTELVVDYTLKALQDLLAGHFVRVHRNSLINKSCLRTLSNEEQGVTVTLVGSDKCFVVSRRHLSEVKQCFQRD